MGEDMVTEKPVENGSSEVKEKVEEKDEVVADKKGEEHVGVTEMEVDKGDEGKVEAQEMDVDKKDAQKAEEIENLGGGEEKASIEMNGSKTEHGGNGKAKTEDKEELLKDTTVVDSEQKKQKIDEDVKGLKVEEAKSGEPKEQEEKAAEHKSEDKKAEEQEPEADEKEAEEPKTEEKETEEPTKGKGSTKRPRSKSSAGKKDKGKKKETEEKEKEQETPTEKKKDPKASAEKKDKEPKTPVTPYSDRPVRERKSVERLVAVIEKDNAKDFQIEKGRGVALKDIPNVAHKMSRKKTDDNLKLLHTILFGRRGKAALVKNNILRFSGFVWHGNEEKQMEKVKEKLDKCVKEKLIEYCDVFDIPVSKAHSRKEDMVAKLIEFLVKPKASTSDVLAEKEQSKKRKRGSTPSKNSAKVNKGKSSSKKSGGKSTAPISESEDESDEGKEEIRGSPDRSDDEITKEAESNEKGSESEEDEKKEKPPAPVKSSKKKASAKKVPSEKNNSKKTSTSKKASPPPKKASIKSQKDETSAKKSSGKKKEPTKKSPIPKQPASKESTGKKVLKAISKPKEETSKLPSDDDLRNATCEILKEVDFNTATFTDILKKLATRFDTDLTPRKASVKIMIQDELTKLADAEEAEEEDVGDGEKDGEKKASSVPSAVKG